MVSAFPKRFCRGGINLFFVYVCLVTLIEGLLMVRLSRGWTISDWLINYQGGFVRRGLSGEVAFQLARFLHITPVFFVVAEYLVLYAILFWAVREIALATSYNVWILALIISPATLSLQILGPQAGFHKELIYLAAFALLIVLLQRFVLSSIWISGYLAIIFVLGTLSHEVTIFYCPYFIAALILTGRTTSQALRLFAVPFALAAVALYFCTLHTGNTLVAEKICSSLGYKLIVPGSLEICASGAIPYLTKTKEVARMDTLAVIRDYEYLKIFPLFAMLALLPAVGESFVLMRSGFKRRVGTVWIVAGVSFLMSLALFVYGVDWGRWIYLHVLSIAILLMVIDGQAKRVQPPSSEKNTRRGFGYGLSAAMFLFVYGTFWILPHASEPLRLGYIGRLQYLTHFSSQPKNQQRAPVQ